MTGRCFERAHTRFVATAGWALLALACACAAEPQPDAPVVTAAAEALQPSAAGAPATWPDEAELQSSTQRGPIDWICVTIKCNSPSPGQATCVERCNCPPGNDLICNTAARIECPGNWLSRKVRFCRQ